MPPFPVQQRLNFTLPHDKEREILERVMDNSIKNVQQAVAQAFPEGLPMTDKPGTPEERFERYQRVTYEEDYPLLAVDGYIAKFKRGELRPFMSPFWQHLILLPEFFEEMRKDYLRVSAHLYEEA